MKITTTEPEGFRPIVLTLETPQEANFIRALIGPISEFSAGTICGVSGFVNEVYTFIDGALAEEDKQDFGIDVKFHA